MILKTNLGDAELRSEYGSSAIPIPGSSAISYAGRNVTSASAAGLPAVGAAIRIISETIASLPMIVYQRDGEQRDRAIAAPQWKLLHDQPNAEQSPYDFFSDIAASIESCGNAFVQKIKSKGRVVELIPIDPDMVQVYRDRGTAQKVFDVRINGKVRRGLTTTDILHVRGFTLQGGIAGISPIQEHRQALGNAIALQEYQGRFFSNDATPGLVIKTPGTLSSTQAKQVLQVWADTHGGLGNAHRPAILANGAELQRIPAMDSEWAETHKLGIADVARIYRLPLWALAADDHPKNQSAEEDSLRFLLYSLGPRLRRIEMAFRADPDLFGSGSDLFCEFLAESLLRASTPQRYAAYVQARQAGWLSANEIRQREGLPPIDEPGADSIQITPVGGAPNPTIESSTVTDEETSA